jgi:hypothetical protein
MKAVSAWWMVLILMVFYILSLTDRQIMSMLVIPMQAELGLSDFEISLILGPAFAVFHAVGGFPTGLGGVRASSWRHCEAGASLQDLIRDLPNRTAEQRRSLTRALSLSAVVRTSARKCSGFVLDVMSGMCEDFESSKRRGWPPQARISKITKRDVQWRGCQEESRGPFRTRRATSTTR